MNDLIFNKELLEIEETIKKGLKNLSSYPINLSNLNDNFTNELSGELRKKENNCLYWFETKNEEDAEYLVQLLEEERESLKKGGSSEEKQRVIPPRNGNSNSSVLYVGVRQGGKPKKNGETHIEDRVKQHLGLYEKGSTQGLQLKYWAENKVNKDKKMTLKIMELDIKEVQHLYIIEKLFAIKLKPLLGKH
jgi:hypothetical protein